MNLQCSNIDTFRTLAVKEKSPDSDECLGWVFDIPICHNSHIKQNQIFHCCEDQYQCYDRLSD